ncbi:hypothetical protein KDW_19640 [Dictyobacter vulcani]|uniref:Nuclease SbcCD subunit C n=1 Tax=Dictyobacter vulcani TaxID=2607529 RepID=A0A5J4KL43_9CHLR|nr:AAA family ATPase [Dictyobacter vulcani]GER87802.1 hypothetical protein KDW_19640 [Dictyobacter vulcani]
MIILKHLTIERFRLLRSMNLHFPQRGSILIQGPNEAGKSALIESIYFALYGEPLASRRGQRSLDDLILYGSTSAVVTLTISVGATELTIARTIERGRGQSVSLLIHSLGSPDEELVTDLDEANARIIRELGNLDGETLRDSGLIEQKGLTRLESISGSAREKTVRNLLGLDTLAALSEQFQVLPEDEERLNLCSERFSLAEVQARIPQIRSQLSQLDTALDTVQVHTYLADIEQQERDIKDLEQALDQVDAQRLELKSRQGRVSQLKKADATLSEIISSYEDIADARRELPVLEQRIADLESREREELPKAEQRVSDLAELTRSFGTLQRMSNDLLTAVDSIKDLEQDLKAHTEAQQDLRALDEQMSQVRSRLADTQRRWQELDEHRRSQRPQLEERLQRLQYLSDRLTHLGQLEESYTRRVSGQSQAEENAQQLQKVIQDIHDAEQEHELIEQEEKQLKQQADASEQAWRQLNIRRQVEEWHRLKGLAQGLAQAEQNVYQAQQQQGDATRLAMDARATTIKFIVLLASCIVAAIVFLIVALSLFASNVPLALVVLLVALLAGAPAYFFFQKYRQSRVHASALKLQEHEASSRVSTMVTAREAALRMAGNEDALRTTENEIRSLGGSVPPSIEEAQLFLDRTRDQGDLNDAQQKMQARLDEVKAAHDRTKTMLDRVTALRQEQASLEALRTQEQWDNIEEHLQNEQVSVEHMHQEITLLAAQEGLPMPSINARVQRSPVPPSQPSFLSGALEPVMPGEDTAGVPELEILVDSTIKATEHEIVSLDGKLDMLNDLANQSKSHQDSLANLAERKQSLEERNSRYYQHDPAQQIEQAREQQMALRSALQSLQDSLRQRVKPLGVAFGQSAVGSAEVSARKVLEELHITLGNKIMLQERHEHYTELLHERQESLSEHYKQLAKFSNTLGSWIVPLNPFAEALVALRSRCQKELHEANEEGILRELESLQNQERASRMRIELCLQEIRGDQASISNLLAAHDYEVGDNYSRSALVALWPLLDAYGVDDNERLEDEVSLRDQELQDLLQQEQSLAQKLAVADETLDLELARSQMEQEERAYLVKKQGHQLLTEVEQRLLRKVQPRTQHYMQQILPLLTGGRYQDVHVTTEPDDASVSGGSFQIEVWDSAAGEYVPTSVLSGGAADLLSLSLRLAFAIATLPADLNIAPGFVLLDEPLSSFDRGRAQALVDVVTGDILSQHFEQIILLSHSNAFDPAMFPYHLYMDNGLMVESNLPIVPLETVSPVFSSGSEEMVDSEETPDAEALEASEEKHEATEVPVTPEPDDFDEEAFDEDDDGATVAVAAIKLPPQTK